MMTMTTTTTMRSESSTGCRSASDVHGEYVCVYSKRIVGWDLISDASLLFSRDQEDGDTVSSTASSSGYLSRASSSFLGTADDGFDLEGDDGGGGGDTEELEYISYAGGGNEDDNDNNNDNEESRDHRWASRSNDWYRESAQMASDEGEDDDDDDDLEEEEEGENTYGGAFAAAMYSSSPGTIARKKKKKQNKKKRKPSPSSSSSTAAAAADATERAPRSTATASKRRKPMAAPTTRGSIVTDAVASLHAMSRTRPQLSGGGTKSREHRGGGGAGGASPSSTPGAALLAQAPVVLLTGAQRRVWAVKPPNPVDPAAASLWECSSSWPDILDPWAGAIKHGALHSTVPAQELPDLFASQVLSAQRKYLDRRPLQGDRDYYYYHVDNNMNSFVPLMGRFTAVPHDYYWSETRLARVNQIIDAHRTKEHSVLRRAAEQSLELLVRAEKAVAAVPDPSYRQRFHRRRRRSGVAAGGGGGGVGESQATGAKTTAEDMIVDLLRRDVTDAIYPREERALADSPEGRVALAVYTLLLESDVWRTPEFRTSIARSSSKASACLTAKPLVRVMTDVIVRNMPRALTDILAPGSEVRDEKKKSAERMFVDDLLASLMRVIHPAVIREAIELAYAGRSDDG
jgi:hypothetical protein